MSAREDALRRALNNDLERLGGLLAYALTHGGNLPPERSTPPDPAREPEVVEVDDETFDRNRDDSLKSAGYDLTESYPEYGHDALREAYRLGWDDRAWTTEGPAR